MEGQTTTNPVTKSNDSIWTIKERCSLDWNKMRGDDKRRFCEQCQKYVHNISAMNKKEKAAFADPENRKECVYYFQRNNGSIADLSFWFKLRRWFPILRFATWSALIGLLPMMVSGCMGISVPRTPSIPIQQETKSDSMQPALRTNNVTTAHP